jgi:arylsulfatase A-like enzyme
MQPHSTEWLVGATLRIAVDGTVTGQPSQPRSGSRAVTAPFTGTTPAQSSPRPIVPDRAPDGAPNVVVIVLDDLGFGQLGCFGSDIATPNIDRLAAGGLRYNRFHVTALCSPTRAALLTGRNHHAIGMGLFPELALHYDGYHGRIPKSAATIARVLRDGGYSTFAVGKWHLTPRGELGAAGPFERWPLGLGFERYYGFLPGDTNQYSPQLVSDNHFVEPPEEFDPNYHLTEDLVDQARRMILDQHQAAPGKPFFCYLAPGAMHAPHSVAPEWSDAYRGHFDDGWEAWRTRIFERQLASGIVPEGAAATARPSWVQDWAGLSTDERRLYARMMEIFAGFLTHTDAQIGRLLDFLTEIGRLDNTIVMLISDNGTSAEGSPVGSNNEHRFPFGIPESFEANLAAIDDLGTNRAYNHYAWGWAWAGNTPFKLWKRYTWLGGTRTPLIVHWPAGIDAAGEIRNQFCHAIDLTPTLLDAAGVEAPRTVDGVNQQPIDGASLVPTFTDADAPSPRRVQYFEILGSRSIYLDGWKATTDHVGQQVAAERELLDGSREFETDRWSLYHLEEDFSEDHDLADAEPEKLRELEQRWWFEAGRNNVLPLDDGFMTRFGAMIPVPYPAGRRAEYRTGGAPVVTDAMPMMIGGFTFTAHIDPAVPHLEGILAAQGNWTGGWAFYVVDGQLVFVVNTYGIPHRFVSDGPIASGATELAVSFTPKPPVGGAITFAIDGVPAGEGVLTENLPFTWQVGGHGMSIGRDWGLPVHDEYKTPFRFTGVLRRLVLDAGPPVSRAPKDRIQEIMHSE